MKNDEPKKEFRILNSDGYLILDERLLSKKGINAQQKLILSEVISMLNSNDEYFASNAYIELKLGLNQKTISKALTLFFERGWMQVDYVGNERIIEMNSTHIEVLMDYLGTTKEHKQRLKDFKDGKRKVRKSKVNKTTLPTPSAVEEKSVTQETTTQSMIEVPVKSPVEGIPVTPPKPASKKMNKEIDDGDDEDCTAGTCLPQNNNDDKKIAYRPEMKPVLEALKTYLQSKGEDIIYDLDEIIELTGQEKKIILESLDYLHQQLVILKSDKYIFVKTVVFKDFYREPFQVVKPKKDEEEQTREDSLDEHNKVIEDSEITLEQLESLLIRKEDVD